MKKGGNRIVLVTEEKTEVSGDHNLDNSFKRHKCLRFQLTSDHVLSSWRTRLTFLNASKSLDQKLKHTHWESYSK